MEDTSKMSIEQVLAYLLTQVSTLQATVNSLKSDTSTQITDAKTLLEGEVGSLSNNIDSLQTIIDEQSQALTDETLNRANSVQDVSSRVSQVVAQQITDRTDLLAQILAYYQKGALNDARISTQLNNTTTVLLQADKELRDKVDTFTQTLEGEYTEIRTGLTDVQDKLTWYTGDSDSIRGDSDINAGKWTILAEARMWETKFADYASQVEATLMDTLRDMQAQVASAQSSAELALSKTDVTNLTSALLGAVGSSMLDSAISTKLAKLDTYDEVLQSLANDNVTAQNLLKESLINDYITPQGDAITQEINNRTDAISSESQKRNLAIQEMQASITNDMNASIATIESEQQTLVEANKALATTVDQLSTTLDGHTTAIQSVTQTVDGVSAMSAVTVDNNGVISGYGLVSELVNGQVTSAFGVNADTFYVGKPTDGNKVFAVIDGKTVIQTALIGELDAGKITTGTLSADVIKAKSLTADKFNIDSLSALSANFGTIITYKNPNNPTGARMIQQGGLLQVYDDNNVLRVRLGFW